MSTFQINQTASLLFHTDDTTDVKRKSVACALELIAHDLSAKSSVTLEGHLDNLPKYVTAIESALRTNSR
ncbi:hypothetical protein ACVGAB_003225 [Vibrio parahaemolyticus]